MPEPTPPTAAARRSRRVADASASSPRRCAICSRSRFHEVWVEGELSNARVWNTGHLYFTLKDGGAQIKGVMFRSALRYLKFKPEDGLHVVARGRISVYDPKGEYQIVCEHMEPQGLGALQLAFEQLKKKLAAEGLFDQARKRPLPALPRRIGIVTSIDGAALRDIIRVLRRRYPNAHLVIAPARVQGEGAAREVAHALRQIVPHRRRRRHHRRARRRLARRPVGVQRRGRGARHRRLAGAGHLRASATKPTSPSPTSSPTCARRRRRRPPSSSSAARTSSSATSIASASGSTRRCDASPAPAGSAAARAARRGRGSPACQGRVAVRGRHVAELAAQLRRASGWPACSARPPRRDAAPRRSTVRSAASPRRGSARALVARRAARRRGPCGAVTPPTARLRRLAARLDGLSPLAVLGRGYAVCWDADRTRIMRDAVGVAAGRPRERHARRSGELACEVTRSDTADRRAERRPDA